jgi:hypothetical protein
LLFVRDTQFRERDILSAAMRLLFTVTQAFTIQGRGVVLLPELRLIGEERFSVGDPLLLKRPDGKQDQVRIGGLEFACTSERRCQLVVMLTDRRSGDVPIGTEVWSVEQVRE